MCSSLTCLWFLGLCLDWSLGSVPSPNSVYASPADARNSDGTLVYDPAKQTGVMKSMVGSIADSRKDLDLVRAFAPLRGLTEELVALYPAYSLREVEAAILRGIQDYMLNSRKKPGEFRCVMDFNGCPRDWRMNAEGLCVAPLWYQAGNNQRTLDLKGMTASDKVRLQSSKGVVWECANPCTKDYEGHMCPFGWRTFSVGGVPAPYKCEAPADYTGPCVHIYDFEHHGFMLKRQFEEICEVAWPCLEYKTIGV